MSQMIPRETIDVLRQQVDVSVKLWGIDCGLYLPTGASLDASEKLDVYHQPSDLTYNQYTAKVFIEWSTNTHRLRKLGVFTEEESPILAWFGRKATEKTSGTEVDVDIVPRSYFTVALEFVPDNVSDTGQFQIVDVIPGKFHDAIIRQGFLVAPRRVE